MKKITLSLSVCALSFMLIPYQSSAQTDKPAIMTDFSKSHSSRFNPFETTLKNRISINAGFGSYPIGGMERMADDNIDGKCYDADSDGNGDPLIPYVSLSLGYLHNISRRIAIGAYIGWSGSKSANPEWYDDANRIKKENGEEYTSYVNNSKKTSYFIIPTANYYWQDNNDCSIYSGLSAGVAIRHHDVNTTTFTQKDNEYWDFTKSPSTTETKAIFAYHITALGIEFGGKHLRFNGELGYGFRGYVNFGAAYRF